MTTELAASRKALGRRLAELRGSRSQKEFAALLNIGRASLARYELGERALDTDLLSALYVLVKVDPLWLLTGLESSDPKWGGNLDEAILIKGFRQLNPRAREHVLEAIRLLAAHCAAAGSN